MAASTDAWSRAGKAALDARTRLVPPISPSMLVPVQRPEHGGNIRHDGP